MPEQLSFAGFDVLPKPTDRLFFAIYPDAEAAARVTALARQLRETHELTGRPLATDRFHVTLHHLGDYVGVPAELVASATKAAEAVSFPPFDIVFDSAGSFAGRPGNYPFVLRGGGGFCGIIEFQRALGAALNRIGLGRKGELNFTPHATLLYDRHRIDQQAVAPLVWKVTEFVLVHSLLGRTLHVPLARWTLRG